MSARVRWQGALFCTFCILIGIGQSSEMYIFTLQLQNNFSRKHLLRFFSIRSFTQQLGFRKGMQCHPSVLFINRYTNEGRNSHFLYRYIFGTTTLEERLSDYEYL